MEKAKGLRPALNKPALPTFNCHGSAPWIVTTVVAALFCWATFVYWPPWHRLERFKIVSDDAAAIFAGARAPDRLIQIAARP